MQPHSVKQSNSWWIDILFLTATLGALYFILLGSRPLFVPDEGRYAEIAREMYASGDYITPFLNGIKYFEKPPLFYWLSALSIQWFGVNIWSVRIVNALFGIIGCLLTYGFTRKFYNHQTALLSAFILGTSSLYFVMAHMVSLDLPVTIFLMACLYAFLLGASEKPGWRRRGWFYVSAVSAAFAVLTKGLIGVVFPLMIIASWIAYACQWHLLRKLYLPSVLFLFILIAAPWHWLVNFYNPEFFYFYFIEQHILRYTTIAVGHYQPIWFFIPCLLFGFFPWVVFLPQSLFLNPAWRKPREYSTELFLILWVTLIFIFFSFSKSKLIPYILPIFPPLAILVANYLTQQFANKQSMGIKLSYFALFILIIILNYILLFHGMHIPISNFSTAWFYLAIAAIIFLGGVILSFSFLHRNNILAIVSTIVGSALFLIFSFMSFPSLDVRTIQPLASIIQQQSNGDEEIITYKKYYQDLPFYLQKYVHILDWRNELSFGLAHQKNVDWMINETIFWKKWYGQKRVFVLIGFKDFDQLKNLHPHEKIYLLGKTTNTLLISNQPT